jgi:phosphomannomutase
MSELPLPPLRFGTDGWRGIIGDDFTLANLERMAQATADVLARSDGPRRVVVGHDRRFMADRHADRVGEVLAGNGLTVLRTTGDLPTPALSGLVVDHGAALGLMLTASHNPPEFGGYKIKSARGGSAAPSFTRRVEATLDRTPVRRLAADEAARRGLWHRVDFRRSYLERLGRRVERETLRAAPRLTVIVDVMHGCGDDLAAEFLEACGHRVITLRRHRDVLFGGAGPEPIPERLAGLREAVLREGADMGLATDGDADRLAAVDETGRFLSALQITPLLALDRLRRCGESGLLARTFANTMLLDRIAAAHGVECRVFPIGFKHLVPLLESGELLVGGEESGGIGVSGTLPERDGTLVGLLLAEMRAARGLALSSLLREMWDEFGEFHYRRLDLAMASEAGAAAVARLRKQPPAALAGFAVTGMETLDGVKLLLGTSGWIMARPSGTEPVLRLYCELSLPERLADVLAALEQRLRA